ncbi:MAG: glycoside hydrolase family 18 protein [Terracidiphilus sp.]|jgi:chitinase
MKNATLCLIVSSLVLFSFGTASSFAADSSTNAIIAYVFARNRALGPNEVDAAKLTRINYAFANIQSGQIVAGYSHDRDNFVVLNNLKKVNPQLQILVSVGGWIWSSSFSDVALTPSSRRIFIDSVVQFLRDNQLDGLDIDWEYPASVGNGNIYRPEDKQNYTALLKELRHRFNREEKALGRRLILSIAAGTSEEFVAKTEMKQVQRYVDSVNLMSYDYYESGSDAITGHHAPLYANPADPKHASADASVKLFEQAGVPSRKLILGVPFYGRAWADVGGAGNGLYQPGRKADMWANYSDIAGNLLNNGFVRYWDNVSSVPWLYNPDKRVFISYEDRESILLKCHYVLDHRLGGVMFWEYTGDTPDHALLEAINDGLVRSQASDASPATHAAAH